MGCGILDAALCFCRGGPNAIIQSLASSVPLIIFPGSIFERRFNAEYGSIDSAI
jgi:UDP:flavonoid glycosyltransferase YjiC (YdhE family)